MNLEENGLTISPPRELAVFEIQSIPRDGFWYLLAWFL